MVTPGCGRFTHLDAVDRRFTCRSERARNTARRSRRGRAPIVRVRRELASASAQKRACRSTTYVREVPGLSTQVTSMVLTA